MDFTSRLGDAPGEAHVNYRCPCGCVAGLMYERDAGPQHLGRCCCGRLLWVGPQASAVLRTHYKAGREYECDLGSVRLPWGEEQPAVIAVPLEALAREDAKRRAGKVPTKVVDPVCRMMFDPDDAAATSTYQGTTYYFCAEVCKASFDANPRGYVSE
jgi:Cu+-exporting ATPase